MKNNKKDGVIVGVAFLVVVAIIFFVFRGDYNGPDAPPRVVVAEFYGEWISSISNGHNPVEDSLFSKSKLVTDNLPSNIEVTLSASPEGFDPVLCSGGLPNSFSLVDVGIFDNSAVVDITEQFTGSSKDIRVELLRKDVDAHWRIDNIDCGIELGV